MAAIFCPACGRLSPLGSQFCPACGAPLSTPPSPGISSLTQGQAGGGWPPSSAGPAATAFGSPYAAPGTGVVDGRALEEARFGTILAMAGLLLGFSGWIASVVLGRGGALVGCRVGGCATRSASVGSAVLLVVAGVAALVLLLVAAVRFRACFQTLAPIDGRFRGPARFSLLLVIGSVLLVIGIIAVVFVAGSLQGPCGAANYNYTSCSNSVDRQAGVILEAVAAIVIGGVLALIGAVTLLLGLWRLGSRYRESLIQVGTVLLIIPFLDVVAPVLIYLGVTRVKRAVTGGGGTLGAPGRSLPPSPPQGAR